VYVRTYVHIRLFPLSCLITDWSWERRREKIGLLVHTIARSNMRAPRMDNWLYFCVDYISGSIRFICSKKLVDGRSIMQCETMLFLRQILCTFGSLCLLRMINRGIVCQCFKLVLVLAMYYNDVALMILSLTYVVKIIMSLTNKYKKF